MSGGPVGACAPPAFSTVTMTAWAPRTPPGTDSDR
jgi:hypothetical protein